ncbi:CG12391, partial [Drosophila busckii]
EQSAEPEDEATAKDAEAKKVAEGEDDIIEEPEEEAGDGDDEGELIVGDDAEQALAVARSGGQKQEEPVDENQCRVCTNKEQLVSLFNKVDKAITPADLLMSICPNVSIALKDFMPQFICSTCLASLTIAIQLRTQLEDTERDLRKRLSRSKNKVRRPRGYVVIDAPVSDSASDEDEELNDEEFKVSDEEAVSTSPDTVSSDSDASEKRKPGRKRGRKKGSKRAAGSNSDEEFQKKKSSLQLPAHGPFECDQCELTFARKQSYIMHRKTHDSRQLYSCQICQKKFKVQGAYRTHMERHAQERAHFRCELCPQVFKLRVELKRHMAMRHDEHGVMYECKRCQRTFLTQQRLQRHQSTSCVRYPAEQKMKRHEGHPSQGRDLFKSVAPLTTTYWSDSFSD